MSKLRLFPSVTWMIIPSLVLLTLLTLAPLTAQQASTDEATSEAETTTPTAELAQTYEFTAGAPRVTAYLAPDGQQFIYLNNAELCLYSIDDEQQHCLTLPDEASQLDSDSLSWSPDSRYVAFALAAFLYFIDSDIWVYDTVENEVMNVTQDDTESIDFDTLETGNAQVDLSPQWTADGRLWFLRGDLQDTQTIFSLDLESMESTEISGYQQEYIGQYQIMDVTSDGSLVALAGGFSGEEKGVVIHHTLTEEADLTIPLPEEFSPLMLSFSPDSQYLLLMDGTGLNLLKNAFWVLDLATGALAPVDPDLITQAAGWLPDQNGLVYAAFDFDTDSQGLYFTSVPDESREQLLEGDFWGLSGLTQPLFISAADNLLINYSDGSQAGDLSPGYVLAEISLD